MKEYIRDNGRVRLCSSNVAKMNLLESMYYHWSITWANIVDAINDLIRHWYIIINVLIIFTLPVTYPIMAWWKIHKAKREMDAEHGKEWRRE